MATMTAVDTTTDRPDGWAAAERIAGEIERAPRWCCSRPMAPTM